MPADASDDDKPEPYSDIANSLSAAFRKKVISGLKAKRKNATGDKKKRYDRMIAGYENPTPLAPLGKQSQARMDTPATTKPRGVEQSLLNLAVAVRKGRQAGHGPSPLSTPKEIAGSHGHRSHGKSIRWPALYEHLRAKGHSKRKAAMISNGMWRKKRGLPPKSVKGTKGMVGVNKSLAGKPYKLYYFQGRNTGIAARSVEEARQKKKRGGDKLMGVRTPTPSENRQMEKDIWVRTRLDGKSPEKSSMGHGRGFGPPRVKKNYGSSYKCKFGLDPSKCKKCPLKKMMPAPSDVLSPEPLKTKRKKMTRKERKARMEQLMGSDLVKSLRG